MPRAEYDLDIVLTSLSIRHVKLKFRISVASL